jgi:hypothetical protein
MTFSIEEHNIIATRGRMPIVSKCLPVLAAFVCATAVSAQAQDTPRGLVEVHDGARSGFWGAVGVGAGGESFDLRDGAGYNSELYRPTLSLRLGGTVSQNLRLGGEALAWIDDQGDRTATLSSFLFIAQFYPVTSSGLYIKGGAGLGRNEIDFNDGFGVGDTGFAGLVGAGWEVRVGRKIYLNPAVDLVEHAYSGRGGDRYRERLLNLGVGVLFQSGR